MTSLATLILKLSHLTKQSEFYLSQCLGALIHLPRVWRNLHADLHLTALTVTILQLTRQLRMSSLIRIGAPPLLKLSGPKPELKSVEEIQSPSAALPLDLPTLQRPLEALQESALEPPNTFQAITHTLFQTAPRVERIPSLRTYSTTTNEGLERATKQAPQHGKLPTSPHLTDEGPAEESLRDSVVERWLQQQEETGRRPMMSFVEAHKLYRDLFEEFVATSILPPNLFAERFLETPHNLTIEQTRTDLRVRLNASSLPEDEGSNLESQPETKKQIPSILLPSYITSTLWAKGSLAFGGPTQSNPPSSLRLTQSTSDASNPSTPSTLGSQLAYMDVWERDVTASDDPAIRERALSGIDTTTRSRTNFNEIIQKEDTATPHTMESNIAPSDRIDLETKDHLRDTHSRDLSSETNSTDAQPLSSLAAQEPSADDIQPARELAPYEYSADHRLISSSDHSKQNLRVYSPAAALYTALAAHAGAAFISPRRGNGHTSPPTIHTSPLRPPLAIVRDLKNVAFTESNLNLPQHTGPVIEQPERVLPMVESHPTPIYLRPPMNLPAVESAVPQRIPASTLPSPNIAPTRENIAKRDLNGSDEDEEEGEAEGYPEIEDDEGDAEIREQVKRFGKIIAEEARRHIGST